MEPQIVHRQVAVAAAKLVDLGLPAGLEANESTDGFLYPMPDYHRTMREVLEQGKRALPEASCLVIGAMDRAAKVGDEIVSLRVMPELLANQKRAALDAGCAFFDTWTAMGGARSMPRPGSSRCSAACR